MPIWYLHHSLCHCLCQPCQCRKSKNNRIVNIINLVPPHSVPPYHIPVVGHLVSLTNSPFPNEYVSQGGSVNTFDVNAQMFYQHERDISEILRQQQQLSLTEEP